MIYKVDDGGFVASSSGVWIPGSYEDERAAKYAFKFTDEQLQKLQDKKNKTTHVITFEDLQSLRKAIKREQNE